MRNYKLEVELSFLAENEALEIMDSCASLLKGVNPDENTELINKFKGQVNESVKELEGKLQTALASKDKITELSQSANSVIGQVLKIKDDCERMLGQLDRQLKDFQVEASTIASDIEKKHGETKRLVDEVSQNALSCEENVKEIRNRIEVARFIRDIANFNKNIITGGKVRLIGPDDLGNPREIKKWEA